MATPIPLSARRRHGARPGRGPAVPLTARPRCCRRWPRSRWSSSATSSASSRASAGPVAVVGGPWTGSSGCWPVARPNDRVAVEDPGYPGVLELVRSMGMDPRSASPPTTPWAGPRPRRPPTLDAGAAGGGRRHDPRAQNPTGAAVDAASLGPESCAPSWTRIRTSWWSADEQRGADRRRRRTSSVRTGRRSWAVARTTSKVPRPRLPRTGFLLADPRTARAGSRNGSWSALASGDPRAEASGPPPRGPTTTSAPACALAADVCRSAAPDTAEPDWGARHRGARPVQALNVWVPVPHESARGAGAARRPPAGAVRAGEPHRTHTANPFHPPHHGHPGGRRSRPVGRRPRPPYSAGPGALTQPRLTPAASPRLEHVGHEGRRARGRGRACSPRTTCAPGAGSRPACPG